MNTFRKLRDIAVLTRPHNCLIALISVLAGAFLAPGGISSGAVLASVMVFFGCAGAYVLNDMYDRASDAINKPGRPLAGGRLSMATGGGLVIGLWALALAFGMLSGKVALLFCVGWMILLWAYSWKLKRYGIIGHIAVSAAGASVLILGAMSGGSARAGFMPSAIVLMFHLSREIAKGVSDAKGDRAVGATTLAVRLGERRSLRIALWCIGGVIVLSLAPFVFRLYGYLYLLPVVLVVYPLLAICILKIARAGDETSSVQRASESVAVMLKAAMPAGLVAFFLAGM